MSFDPNGLRRAQWEPQTADIPVPENLREVMGVDVVTVRGLDGLELAKMRAAGRNGEVVAQLVRDLVSNQAGKDTAQQFIGALGLDPNETPEDVVKHVFAVEHGTHDPQLPRDNVITLNKFQPAFFTTLAQKILELSAEGFSLGKSPHSGKITALNQT